MGRTCQKYCFSSLQCELTGNLTQPTYKSEIELSLDQWFSTIVVHTPLNHLLSPDCPLCVVIQDF